MMEHVRFNRGIDLPHWFEAKLKDKWKVDKEISSSDCRGSLNLRVVVFLWLNLMNFTVIFKGVSIILYWSNYAPAA